ncbi:DUF3604 domain-containing protein [Halococcus sp. IIIV-5B]|nr:DUF3604 domain-containing protein [Halococcus sp. IIIV-5B]
MPSLQQLVKSRDNKFADTHCILPSTMTIGETADMTILVWDHYERLVRDFEGTFTIECTDPAVSVPDQVRFAASNNGIVTIQDISFESTGIHYIRLTNIHTGEIAVSNPVKVTDEPPEYRLYWGDIHFHSRLSDGVGSIEKGFRYARDVMQLDVVACTDHDTMGFFIPPKLQRRRMHRRYFQQTKDAVTAYHDPDSFVTLLGYEWTKQPNSGGHINVYFNTIKNAELFDSQTVGTDTYEGLWRQLRQWKQQTGNDVLTIPHHSAEAMYPFDFSRVEYDDEMAPLVEVYSQWGSSEYPGSEGNTLPIGGIGQGEIDRSGYYAQDALQLGYKIGLMASSDIHGPWPGHSFIHVPPHLPRLSEILRDGIGWGFIWRIWDEKSYPGGLVAFYAPELTRDAIFRSLKNRQVYGTTQPHRMILSLAVNGVQLRQGISQVTVNSSSVERCVSVGVAGTAPLEQVEVIKNNKPWRIYSNPVDDVFDFGKYTMEREYIDQDDINEIIQNSSMSADDFYYIRATQADGGVGWAGPIWVSVSKSRKI